MKTGYIGILGGLGYRSTILVYQKLNEGFKQRKGETHTCPILLLSIDFSEINNCLPNHMSEAASLLKPHLKSMNEMDVDVVILSNNTLHQAYDLVSASLPEKKPFGHIGELLKQELRQKKANQALLLGTKYTMNSGYLHSYMNTVTEVVIPDETLQEKIETLRKIYYDGEDYALAQECFDEISRYNIDAVVIACTELSIAFGSLKNNSWIDSMDLQCDYALSQIY